jgi:hypothetical protein
VGQTGQTAVDDGHRYIYIGKHIFMRQSDFGNLSTDQYTKEIYDKLKKNEPVDVPVWYDDGKPHTMPSGYILSIGRRDTFNSWFKRQKDNWQCIMWGTGNAENEDEGFDPMARLIQPDTFSGFELVFSPSQSEAKLTFAELQSHVTDLNDNPYPSRVLTWAQANADPNLVLLSSSFYGFYHTWISPTNYQKLCKEQQTVPLARPWPKDLAAAIEIDKKIGVANPDQVQDTDTTVTARKIKASRRMRTTATGQSAVMGNISATTASEIYFRSLSPVDTYENCHRLPKT